MAARQLSLLDREPPSFRVKGVRFERQELGRGAWIEHSRGWMRGQGALFEALAGSTRWHRTRRRMYERVVEVPRLTATLPDDGPGHATLWRAAAALAARYRGAFERLGLALYRDGSDSVAWHADKFLRDADEALIVILSLGGRRKFMLRPVGGGASTRVWLAGGDLLVMGGACQRFFEHGVPKMQRAEPRMSVAMRYVVGDSMARYDL